MIFKFKLSINFSKNFAFFGGGGVTQPCLLFEFYAHVTVSTMASTRTSLPDSILNVQPKLIEVTTHAKTAKWFLLGTQLELDGTALDGCTDMTRMYQLWIQEKAENATRKNLLIALRAINQNNDAKKYEDYLKTLTVSVSY